MNSCILYCPHLNRDIRGLLAQVPDPQILTGYPTPQGHDGCLEMHKAAVRLAQTRNWAAVFVMEDDCEFTEQFDYKKWQTDVEWACAQDYDVLVGGCVRAYNERVVRTEPTTLLRVDVFHSAHCIVYLASSYERVLSTIQPFDMSVGQVGCKVVLTWPFVAVQRASFSGILQEHVDYVPMYRDYEHTLEVQLGL